MTYIKDDRVFFTYQNIKHYLLLWSIPCQYVPLHKKPKMQ